MSDERIPVAKTYKLYVGGKFIRSESGRTDRAVDAQGRFVANLARASRKDLRDAVVAARKAQPGWAARSAFNRSQILARIAEMIENRAALFEGELVSLAGYSKADARAEVESAVDRTFWYSGWPDKFAQVMGGINPVATPFFNFSVPEPTGVVVAITPESAPLLGTISAVLPAIASGNTCLALVENRASAISITLAEALATSDVPGGVVNVLTGPVEELTKHASEHMDVNAIACFGRSDELRRDLQVAAADNLKRIALFDDPGDDGWRSDAMQSPYWLERFVEWKTAWHPIGT